MFRKFCIIILIIFVSPIISAGQNEYIYPVAAACGDWDKLDMEGEKMIATDQADIEGYMEINVPNDGNYQLSVNLFHAWRQYCPFVYVEAKDAEGKSYSNHIFSEPRWYLKEGEGRWEKRSPSAFPFWYLHKGKLKIKFWAKAMESGWKKKEVAMEGKLIINKFILNEVFLPDAR